MSENSEGISRLERKKREMLEQTRARRERERQEETAKVPRKKKEITDLLDKSADPVRIEAFCDLAELDIETFGKSIPLDDEKAFRESVNRGRAIEDRIGERKKKDPNYKRESERFETLLSEYRNLNTVFSERSGVHSVGMNPTTFDFLRKELKKVQKRKQSK